ncbi:hypothetical protein TWF506_005873 [Arthrobotrys conoides]|uniref:Uncharacterized protein n=1 Tax=Arthrobotrys conoides TaxID=74498 RepID=A0AAN8NCT6_9PEZI
MWSPSLPWLLIATLATLSNAYKLSVNLKPIDTNLLTLSPEEDSIENLFDEISEEGRPSILEGTKRLLPALESLENDSPNLGEGGGLSIAGRISLPVSDLHHPIAGYHGAASRQISDILGEAADIPLTRTTSGKSRASNQQREENGVVEVSDDIPPDSRGRCIEFEAPDGEYILQSIILANFTPYDEVPIGISIFSAPGCRKNRGFVGYKEIERTAEAQEYNIDLKRLNQQISNQFSILPVYGAEDTETPLYHTSDEDIGSRPNAPLFHFNRPPEIDLDENLLAEDFDDYVRDLNVPWDRLANAIPQYEEEEKREATPPARRNRPSPWYVNRQLQLEFPGFEIPSPRPWNAMAANSDDEIDSAHVDSAGDRGNSDTILASANNNMAAQSIEPGFDIGDFDLREGSDDDVVAGGNNQGPAGVGTQISVRGYPERWFLELNQNPRLGGLDYWQLPENRGDSSSEDKGLG